MDEWSPMVVREWWYKCGREIYKAAAPERLV